MKTGGLRSVSSATAAPTKAPFSKSYNLAKVWNLPAIFVVEDNGYAESTASGYSVGGSQVGRGQGFGLPSSEVDGLDFFAVYEAAGEAVARARSGGGASLIHSRVLRYYGHFEGDATTYRAPGAARNHGRQSCRGLSGVCFAEIDGVEFAERPLRLRMVDDGGVHRVRVRLG
jgi:pyruvate dehydrogenase E1 component alpha subunit